MKSWQPPPIPPRTVSRRATQYVAAFLLLALLIESQCLAGTSTPNSDSSVLISKTRPALVMLVSVDRRGTAKSCGTGFFVSQEGVLVTAWHVAQAEQDLVAITQDGKKLAITGFIGEDRDDDIAVLKAEGSQCAHLKLGSGSLKSSQPVALVSAQDMIAPACGTGIVAEVISPFGLFETITTTVPVRKGQSGSPLLNAEGDVVGVVSFVSPAGSATGSPIGAIERILAKGGTNSPVAFRRRPSNGNNLPLLLDADFKPALEAFRHCDWREAERRLKRVAKRFPESPFVFTALAMAQVRSDRVEKARANVERAQQLSPDSAMPYLLDAVCLVRRGELAQSLAPVRKALELGLPNHETTCSAWELVAAVEKGLGHNNKAEEALATLQGLDEKRAAELRDQLETIVTKRFNEREGK